MTITVIGVRARVIRPVGGRDHLVLGVVSTLVVRCQIVLCLVARRARSMSLAIR